jgi:hypothetical protein
MHGSQASHLSEDDIRAFSNVTPEHLIDLPRSEWALWRCVGLRSAGFPAATVLSLAASECGAIADQLCRAQERQQQIGTDLHAELNALRQEEAERTSRRQNYWQKAMRRVEHGLRVDIDEGHDSLIERIQHYHEALDRVEALQEKLHTSFDTAVKDIATALHDTARMDAFCEAITWQNRQAFHTAIRSLQGTPPDIAARTSHRRQHEELLARYIQRYCVKNDTIGFFGPVGWAQFRESDSFIQSQPREPLIETRNVYYESWCIDTLAEALSKQEELRPWLIPRQIPFLHIEDCTVHLPHFKTMLLSLRQGRVFRQCDGLRNSKQIAKGLLGDNTGAFSSQAEVYQVLEELQSSNLITWSFEVPTALYPEQTLRQLLTQIDQPELRQSALGKLDALDAARQQVARSAGSAELLDLALGSLEATFTSLTGAAPTRLPGQIYAGRTLVYEECRRNIDLGLGRGLVESFGAALELVLLSARWFTFEAATVFRQVFKQIYRDLAAPGGRRQIDFSTFWEQTSSTLFGDILNTSFPQVETLTRQVQERWSHILNVAAERREVRYSTESLRPKVLELFDAPRPGWIAARYHSPDVLISASSVEAIQRGDYQAILGELHVGINTLSFSCFTSQHPDVDALCAAVGQDLAQPRVILIEDKDWPEFTARSRVTLMSPQDIRLAFADNTAEAPRDTIVPIGSLIIEEEGDTLVVRSRDGLLSFDVVELFADTIAILIASSWKIVGELPHTPRIIFDDLVVCRETWRFAPAALDFAFEKDAERRFVAARKWARDQLLPRCVFIKAPVERKPVYVDFDSPIYVDYFAKIIRRSAEQSQNDICVCVTEMFPDHDHLWLADSLDRRYTAELRLVAVDKRT